MRRAFNNPVGKTSPLAALAAEPAALTRPERRLARPLGLVVLAAVLVLWAVPALGQTLHSIAHTGSATVTGGKIQIEEGGASTTFQFDLQDDFVTDLQAAHPDMATTGARIAGFLHVFRDSSDVTWTTSSGTTFADRTDEFEVSHNGTTLRHRYSAASPTSTFPTSREERLWFYVPLGSSGNGETSSFTNDLAAFEAAFPITFSIKAETDTLYELPESIRVSFTLNASGTQATPPFSSFQIGHETLTFELVNPRPDPTGKPTTPANLKGTAGKGAVTLAWDAIDVTSSNTNLVNDVNITKHQVRQSTDGGANYGTWTDIPNSAFGGLNAASYTVGSLTDGTEYTFQVRAVNGCTATTGCGNSDPATAAMATPDADGLAKPTGLMATAGNTEVTLTWTAPGGTTTLSYEYQQKAGSAAWGGWTEMRGSSETTTSYRLTGLVNDTTYGYRIRARTNVTTGPPSDGVTATPRGVPPAAPVLTATPRYGGVTLSWPNPVDASLARWEYQYKVGTGVYQPWQTARDGTEEDYPYLDTSGATLQIPVGGLTNGTPHTFRIRAVNLDGTTTSNEATATPVAGVPAKPTGLTTRLDSDGDQRELEWDRVADPSILRYEYTTDEGRTWSHLIRGDRDSAHLPEDEFLSGYTFRIRAVNAAGPGPASEPAVEEEAETTASTGIPVYFGHVSVEYDSSTKKVTLVWGHATSSRFAHSSYWWLDFKNRQGSNVILPIGTTRYELPGQFNGGETVSPMIIGCAFAGACAGIKTLVRWEELARIMREGAVEGETQEPPCGTNVVLTTF